MNRRYMMSLLTVGIVLLITFVVIVPPVGSGGNGDDTSKYVPFVPIWFAIMMPIFVANQRKKKKQEHAKYRLESDNRYNMMKDLVHDLNDDELQYLRRRLYEISGKMMASQQK